MIVLRTAKEVGVSGALLQHNSLDGLFPYFPCIAVHDDFIRCHKKEKRKYHAFEVKVIFRYIFKIGKYDLYGDFEQNILV